MATGSKDVSADEVISRWLDPGAVACFDPLGDSEQDACISSSAKCGVNYTGIGEIERRMDPRLSY